MRQTEGQQNKLLPLMLSWRFTSLSLCEEQIIGTPGSDTLGEFAAEP